MPSPSPSLARRVARPRGRLSPRLLGLGLVACLDTWASSPREHWPETRAPALLRSATGTDAATRTLTRGINELLDRRFLRDAAISLHVRDLARARRSTSEALRALNPASNVKLVTTAAALSILGPAHRYKTGSGRSSPEDGVIDGDLYLVGGGDPSLLTGDLYELASRLRAMGVREIKGGVTVDISLGTDLLPPGYEQKDEFAAYRAPIGAASVNFNSFELRVGPGTATPRPASPSVPPSPPSRSSTRRPRATAPGGESGSVPDGPADDEGAGARPALAQG